MNLENILKLDESESIEFKTSTSEKHQIGETLCAFLNSKAGGRLFVGITPDKKPQGQHVSDHTLQEVAQIIRQIEPIPNIQPNVIDIGNKKSVIVLTVDPHLESIPFTYKGRSFVRIGSTTSLMSRLNHQKLLLEHMHDKMRWELFPAINYTFDHLDHNLLSRIFQKGIELNRIPDFKTLDLVKICEKFYLIDNNVLTNAALVLFMKENTRDYPQCKVKLARFKGIDKTEFLDERTIYGNAFTLLEESMQFVTRHLPVRKRVTSGQLERIEEPLIPFSALREALINAICHRDYSNPSTDISLAIYDDRLEIWNFGALPTTLTIDNLHGIHQSIPRNPNIARLFYVAGLIESWGRGTNIILDLCQEAKLNHPKFISRDYFFGVYFPAEIQASTSNSKWGQLTKQKREILAQFDKQPEVTLNLLIERLPHVHERALRQELETLKKMQLIQNYGHGRASFWKKSINKP